MTETIALAVIGLLFAALQALGLFILTGIRSGIRDLRKDMQTMMSRVSVLEGAARRPGHPF